MEQATLDVYEDDAGYFPTITLPDQKKERPQARLVFTVTHEYNEVGSLEALQEKARKKACELGITKICWLN